jgi:4a-hydroxytetrahydrobiopterin dehydratase
MSELAKLDCVPSRGGVAPLKGSELNDWLGRLGGEWQVIDERHLEKTFKFKDFRQALAFSNRVGELAEAVDHHPELALGWGYVTVRIWTHAIDGLHEADFIFAAKADQFMI